MRSVRRALAPSTKLPTCKDCGAVNPRVVGNGHGGHLWLCADCEYKREHPEYIPMPKLPQERGPRRLQKETLF